MMRNCIAVLVVCDVTLLTIIFANNMHKQLKHYNNRAYIHDSGMKGNKFMYNCINIFADSFNSI